MVDIPFQDLGSVPKGRHMSISIYNKKAKVGFIASATVIKKARSAVDMPVRDQNKGATVMRFFHAAELAALWWSSRALLVLFVVLISSPYCGGSSKILLVFASSPLPLETLSSFSTNRAI